MEASVKQPDVLTARRAAAAMASRGFKVFPVIPGSRLPFISEQSSEFRKLSKIEQGWCRKHPELAGGIHRATRDIPTIERWFAACPDANYGVATAGLVVIDVDVKNGKPGLRELAELGPLPKTLKIRSGTGGFHLYFASESMGQRKLRSAIDVRSKGGYVVGPGSVVDGKSYTVEADMLPAPLPDSLRHELAKAPNKDDCASQFVSELDTDAAVQAAIAFLSLEPGAALGERNMTAYRIACQLKDIGLSPPMIAEVMGDHWNDKNDEPLPEAELLQVAYNAHKSGRHAAGSSNPEAEFGDIVRELPQVLRDIANAPIASPWADLAKFVYTPVDPCNIPPREWLYARHYIRGSVSATIAPGAAGKSSLINAEALSMVVGRDLFSGKKLRSQFRVLVWAGEDNFTELQRRIEAIRKHYSISVQDVGDRLILACGQELPLKVAKEDRTGFAIALPVKEQMIQTFQSMKIDAAIFDPFVKVHECSENDNNRINSVVDVFADIAKEANCSIELVHHVRKLNGGEVTADDARGASAFKDGIRGGVRVINTMTPAQAEKARVQNHKLYFRLEDGKLNMSPPAANADWFHLASVPLNNARDGLAQDEVGVAEPFTWPEPTDGLPEGSLILALQALGDIPLPKDLRSPRWVGHAIGKALTLDTSKPGPDREQVKALIAEWLRQGHLTTTVEKNDRAKHQTCVRVASSSPVQI